MRERRAALDRRRAREFEAFAAGATGRLLHVAGLLTGEPPGAAPRAERLLVAALARTYAEWERPADDDPYDRTRGELVRRFAATAWHTRRRRPATGVLAGLGPQERLVLVLRLYEGLPEEQTAALIGLPAERVHAVYARALARGYATARRTGVTGAGRGSGRGGGGGPAADRGTGRAGDRSPPAPEPSPRATPCGTRPGSAPARPSPAAERIDATARPDGRGGP